MSPNNLILENPDSYSVLSKYFTSKSMPKNLNTLMLSFLNNPLLKHVLFRAGDSIQFYDTWPGMWATLDIILALQIHVREKDCVCVCLHKYSYVCFI